MAKETFSANKTGKNPQNAIANGTGRNGMGTGAKEFEMVVNRTGRFWAWQKLDDKDFEELNAKISKAVTDIGIKLGKGSKFEIKENSFNFQVPGVLTLSRSFDRVNGIMEHDLFDIADSSFQRKGLSKAVHRALIPLYEKLGVKQIEVYASLENGGYTWARNGFRISRRETTHFLGSMKGHKEDAERIINDYFSKNPKSDRFPMNLVASQPWAEESMSGSSWIGSINLSDKTEHDDFYNYVKYKG